MEPTGLALGLAGLIPLYKTCIQLIDLLDSTQPMQTDLEQLSTMLDIERLWLCRWGKAIGLTSDDPTAVGLEIHGRLGDRRVTSAVTDILSCMKYLFEDSYALQKQYGLRKASDGRGGTATTTKQEPSQLTFRQTFKKVFDRLDNNNNQRPSLGKLAKWVIVDRDRFTTLVESLRDLNNDLSTLLPDIDVLTREGVIAEINQSTNVQELFLIEQASTMAGRHDFSDAASAQLSRVSEQETAKSVSTELALALRVDELHIAKQMRKSRNQQEKNNWGMLNASIRERFGTPGTYLAHMSWTGVAGEEFRYFLDQERETEALQSPYLAWDLQYASSFTQLKSRGSQGYEAFDCEASRRSQGKWTGTRSIHGYAANFQSWAQINLPTQPKSLVIKTHPPPNHALVTLVERINDTRLLENLPRGWSNKELYDDVQKWIYGSSGGRVAPGYDYSISDQIHDILAMLNRVDIFDELRDLNEVGMYICDPARKPRFANFLYQMTLAHELRLRLDRQVQYLYGVEYPDLSGRVFRALELSQRWMKHVHMEWDDDLGQVHVHSVVHERQAEGLIRFAEALEWPHLAEMREPVEDAYLKMMKEMKCTLITWTWMYGLMLPGHAFVYTIMSSLVLQTPSLASLGCSPYTEACLVLEGTSYWQAGTVVGRVFGAMAGLEDVCGWIGPCPAPSESSVKGWVRVQARDVGFSLPRYSGREGLDLPDSTHGSVSTASQTPPFQIQSMTYMMKLKDDPKSLRVVEPPAQSNTECKFVGLRLTPLNTTKQLDDPADQEYRATIEFNIDGKPKTMVLYSNPTFIAAYRCIDGPHLLHDGDISRLKEPCQVADLPLSRPKAPGVIVINATCSGGELVARAWCAENGQHAVVCRGGGTCFACAVKIASDQGLGVNCLIWVG